MSEEQQILYAIQMSSKEIGGLEGKTPLTMPSSSGKPTTPTPMNYNNVVRHNNIPQTVGKSK